LNQSALPASASPRLVLASTSVYRRQLLERLRLPFAVCGPDIDESALPGEEAAVLARRLARTKAETVARRYPQNLVVGSDQLAIHQGRVLGKPGSSERTVAQLSSLSGERVSFHTAVHVLDSLTGAHEHYVDHTIVHFRSLDEQEIRRYVALEQPYDCAGGFKAEALGIALFDRIESQDPTALVGLPLIWLAASLRRHGFDLP
jgi:septum formation protein